jgi:hypothetical protein
VNQTEYLQSLSAAALAEAVPAERLAEALTIAAPGHRAALESTLLKKIGEMIHNGTPVIDRETGETNFRPLSAGDALQLAKTLATVRIAQEATKVDHEKEQIKNVLGSVSAEQLMRAATEGLE